MSDSDVFELLGLLLVVLGAFVVMGMPLESNLIIQSRQGPISVTTVSNWPGFVAQLFGFLLMLSAYTLFISDKP